MRLCLVLLAVACWLTAVSAQWTVRVTCQSYPSSYLSDWESRPGIAGIDIDYLGAGVDTVRLVDSLHCREHGFIARGSSDAILFDRAQTVRRDNRDFLNYRGITYNPAYREALVRTNRLLEGTYTLYCNLVRARTGELLTSGNPVSFTILGFRMPSLIAPFDGETLRIARPTFLWNRATSHPGFEVHYLLTVCEVLPGQTPGQAIDNVPLHQATVVNHTSYVYPLHARALEEDREYVWQVQARDRNGLPLGDDEGKSEVFGFLFRLRPGGFGISNLDLAVPAVVAVGAEVRAVVRFDATGDGEVRGRLSIDDSPWHEFSQLTSGPLDSILSPPLPAGEPDAGRHSLKVATTEPTPLHDSAEYEVTSDTLGLDSLLLVPGVALIASFSNPLIPDGPAGSNRYRLSGTCSMRLLSLDDAVVPTCTIVGMKLMLNPLEPFNSIIDTGLVRRRVREDTALFGYKDGFLEATSVEFEKNGAPVDFVTIDAKLNLPRLGATLYRLDDIEVRSTGITGKGFSTTHEFSGWGVTFSLRDVGDARAITLGYERDALWVSLSGDMKLTRDGTQDILTQFTGLRITHRGEVSGRFVLAEPFKLIPDQPYLKVNSLAFLDSLEHCYLKFSGEIESLPAPLDAILPRTDFCFLWDADGNTVGGNAPLNELSPDRRGEGNDPSEFRIPNLDIRLDLTYLGLVLAARDGDLKLSQSRIAAAMDVYFPFRDNAGDLLPVAERRMAIGELKGERLEGGITIDFNGHLNWDLSASIPVVRDKKLDLGDVIRLKLDRLAIEPSPFAFVLNCSLGINVTGVEGGAALEGLKIPLSGDVSLPVVRGGEFRILEVFKASVGSVRWANKDTTFTLNQDQTVGEGEAREFRSGTRRVSCNSFFLMEEALLNIGPGGRLASGDFERFLVYKTEGTKKVSLTGTDVSIAGMQLLADFDYSNPAGSLRLAGTLNLPSGIGVTAVGKVGNRDGDPSVGLFVAAQGLDIPVGPGVMLTGAGGGFFVLPEEVDLATVQHHCGFSRPDMENKFQAKKPRADDPGSFALLLYGEVEVAGTDELVWGKALLTLTTRRFDLDAEVKVLKATGMAEGLCYLSIGWNPAYAEGRIDVDVDVVGLMTGEGQFEFYVYSSDAWGVMGGAELEVVEVADATADFFVGNPGFLLEVEFDYGIDIYVLSGDIEFDGMVWYKQIAPKSWGGYAGLQAEADILGGLAGASFGLEGALIGEPHYLIYCVGSLSVEVCWVEVFSGSIWVSIGADGFDGGTGRNSRYDRLIDDARGLADEMQEEKDRVREAMADAQGSMYALSEEQRERAGSALVEAVGTRHARYRALYDGTEHAMLDNSLVKTQFDTIFDRAAARLAAMRDTLGKKERSTGDFISRIDTTRKAVDQRFADYQAILAERLPSVRDIGALGSPLRGKVADSIIISGRDTSFRVALQTGFDIDYVRADESRDGIAGTQADNERHRQELLRITGVIDGRLRRLDSLLYYSTPRGRNDMSSLCSLYQEGYRQVLDYYWYLGKYTDDNQTDAARKNAFLNRQVKPLGLGSVPCSSGVHWALASVAHETGWRVLRTQTQARQALIAQLDTLFEEREIPRPRDDRDTARIRELRDMWVSYGMELWFNIPKAGYQGVTRFSRARWYTMKAAFRSGTSNFSASWADYTTSLDRVYSRKARLYELLYDLHDQLDLMGDVPTPQPRRWAIAEGVRRAMVERPLDPGRIGPLVVPRKAQLARLLTNPRIISFTGSYRSDNTMPAGFGRLDVGWRATHEEGVVDYSFYLSKKAEPGAGGGFVIRPGPSHRTLGRGGSLWQPFISGVNEPGEYEVFLRARGAGGYATTRRGVVTVAYAGPETPPQRNGMNAEDTTPPTRPVVTTDTIIASTGQISARWRSQDGESGIEEYRYAVGRYFWSEPARAYLYSPIADWTSSGGRTDVNIRGLDLRHDRAYVLKVMAKNGVGLWSPEREVQVRIDTTAPSVPLISSFAQTLIPAPNTVLACWDAAEDRESGILHYEYCLGRSPLGNELRNWDTIPPATSRVCVSPLPLSHGDTVFLTIRAVNRARLHSQDTGSCVVAFTDASPPSVPLVRYAAFTPGDSTLFARWSASDDQSGVADYQYQVESEEVGPYPDFKRVRRVLVPWTSTETRTWVRDRLGAAPAYITVKATNGVGLTAAGGSRVTIE